MSPFRSVSLTGRFRCLFLAGAASAVVPLCGCHSADERAIRQVLTDQTAAWNRGDIDGFMAGYWPSDELEFRTPDGVTKGWQATRERYLKRYDTREKMGTLTFTDLHVTSRSRDRAEVTGRYQLTGDGGTIGSGRFELDVRRFDGEWLIVRDYTVSDPP